MPSIKTVLAPVDFSESSVRAARAALAWAERFGAELHLLHVVPDAIHAWAQNELREFSPDTIVDDWTRGTRDALDALSASLSDTPGRVKTVVRLGQPTAEIVRYATEARTDAIVMASRGHGPVSRALLGSVAEAVVREAPCPVLIVPSDVDVTRWSQDHEGLVRHMIMRTVVALTDFSDLSHVALAHAHEIATQLDATLHVLHVVPESGAPQLAYVPPPIEQPEELRWRAKRALMRTIERFSDRKGMVTVACLGKPGETAVAYADEVNADLIVLGTHGRGAIERLLLGSVAQHVLRHAHCPVLTINERCYESSGASSSRSALSTASRR